MTGCVDKHLTERLTDRQTDRQTDMYAGMPKDSQTDRLDRVWIAVVAFTEES